jgi:hypothetical protein
MTYLVDTNVFLYTEVPYCNLRLVLEFTILFSISGNYNTDSH